MHDRSIELNPSPDWIESSSAKAWARSDLSLERAPSFGSSWRRILQQSIAEDEAEIMRLQDSDSDSIRCLRESIGKNRARLAPTRLLPNEILAAIFLDWLHLRDRRKHEWRDRYFHPPSTVMKVCRRWADCVISSPPIWTHAQYMIDTSKNESFDLVGIFKAYFHRSGSRNLDVHFSRCKESNEHQVNKIWCELMQPSLSRLENLRITKIYTNRTDEEQVRAVADDWPFQKIVRSLNICTRLSQLCLQWIDFPETESQIPILLPALRTINYVVCDGNPPIQCPGLLECEMEQCTMPHSFVRSLSISSPLLEKVKLRWLSYMSSGQTLPPPTFLALKHLVIDYHDSMFFPRSFCDAPNISRLDFFLAQDMFDRISRVIEVISLKSYSALTSLTLTLGYGMIALDRAFRPVLQDWMVQAHGLVEFKLIFDDPVMDPNEEYEEMHGLKIYIEPLLTAQRDPPGFPRLKHIIIRGDNKRELEAELLQLLVERASDAERVEAGYPVTASSPAIIQRPCLLTLENSHTFPEVRLVGLKLKDFSEICQTEASSTTGSDDDDESEEGDDDDSGEGMSDQYT